MTTMTRRFPLVFCSCFCCTIVAASLIPVYGIVPAVLSALYGSLVSFFIVLTSILSAFKSGSGIFVSFAGPRYIFCAVITMLVVPILLKTVFNDEKDPDTYSLVAYSLYCASLLLADCIFVYGMLKTCTAYLRLPSQIELTK